MKYIFLSSILSVFAPLAAQDLTGNQLLDKAIEYHDPDSVWLAFKGKLNVVMKTPNSSDRVSDIILNLPARYFKLVAKRDNTITEMTLDKGKCSISLNGNTEISEEDKKTNRLTCERAKTMKDYYTYLYGLPMKLRDPGTIIDPRTERRSFNGKEYLVLKVNYEEAIGKDTWYFYFDPDTYAMESYQFFHDESKNDGEYILLIGKEEVSGIKMPKTRAWYYNKDHKYLGTDTLTKASSL